MCGINEFNVLWTFIIVLLLFIPSFPISETTLQNEGISWVDGVLYFRTPE